MAPVFEALCVLINEDHSHINFNTSNYFSYCCCKPIPFG